MGQEYELVIFDKNDSEYYDYSLEYMNVSKRVESLMGEIQAYNGLLDHFQFHQIPDSALKYIMEGITLKDSVITKISNLFYLNFISDCFDYLKNMKIRTRYCVCLKSCLALHGVRVRLTVYACLTPCERFL